MRFIATHKTGFDFQLDQDGSCKTEPKHVDILLCPKEDFPIYDLARNITRERRFYNTIEWTVADHCIAMADFCLFYEGSTAQEYLSLMHDLHEGFVRDVPVPVKQVVEEFRSVTDAIDFRIHSFLGVDLFAISEEDFNAVKRLDAVMGLAEAHMFFGEGEVVDLIKEYTSQVVSGLDELSFDFMLSSCKDIISRRLQVEYAKPKEQFYLHWLFSVADAVIEEQSV